MRSVPAVPHSDGSNDARTSTWPSCVNFTELPTRLKATCLSLWGSTISRGIPSALHLSSTPEPLLAAVKASTTSFRSAAQSVGSGNMPILPDSSFDRSRTSLTSPRSVLPLTSIASTAWLRSSSDLNPDFIISEKAMIAFSGVLMSWLTVEKKKLFALAFSRSISSSRRRSILYTANRNASAARSSPLWT